MYSDQVVYFDNVLNIRIVVDTVHLEAKQLHKFPLVSLEVGQLVQSLG